MSDYIKRSDALNFTARVSAKPGMEEAIGDSVRAVMRHIEAIPAADVAPVRHARWIESYAEGETFEGFTEKFVDSFQCSSCGNYAVPDSPYCPHCGARMDA